VFLFAVIAVGGPGCDLLKAPELPGLEAPEAPEVEAPQAPGLPEDKADGACCIRLAASAEKACAPGETRCCTAKYDSSKCEEMKGSWYESARDCSMMC
jgi:hypothetical protein